jgi:hypothetical protein
MTSKNIRLDTCSYCNKRSREYINHNNCIICSRCQFNISYNCITCDKFIFDNCSISCKGCSKKICLTCMAESYPNNKLLDFVRNGEEYNLYKKNIEELKIKGGYCMYC